MTSIYNLSSVRLKAASQLLSKRKGGPQSARGQHQQKQPVFSLPSAPSPQAQGQGLPALPPLSLGKQDNGNVSKQKPQRAWRGHVTLEVRWRRPSPAHPISADLCTPLPTWGSSPLAGGLQGPPAQVRVLGRAHHNILLFHPFLFFFIKYNCMLKPAK